MYTIRQARQSDVLPMMRIGHEGLRPYIEELSGWDQPQQEQIFREHFVLDQISIIQSSGEDVGYVKIEEYANHVFLAGIYVSSQHRRQGFHDPDMQQSYEMGLRALLRDGFAQIWWDKNKYERFSPVFARQIDEILSTDA